MDTKEAGRRGGSSKSAAKKAAASANLAKARTKLKQLWENHRERGSFYRFPPEPDPMEKFLLEPPAEKTVADHMADFLRDNHVEATVEKLAPGETIFRA